MNMSISMYSQEVAPQMEVCKATGILKIGRIAPAVNVHIPRHVAEATAEAFNRAMQAVPQPGGSLKYTTKSADWFIELDPIMRNVWQYQCAEVTGDGDPSWMNGTSVSVLAAMDEIDAIEEENACPECRSLVGERKLNGCTDGNVRCWDCDEAWQERETAMAEAAADDAAHAQRDLARGL